LTNIEAARAIWRGPRLLKYVEAFTTDGDETTEYKAIAALFDRMRPFREKAMANRTERAHGLLMSDHARFQLLHIHAGNRP
jgi:hypothetical protein